MDLPLSGSGHAQDVPVAMKSPIELSMLSETAQAEEAPDQSWLNSMLAIGYSEPGMKLKEGKEDKNADEPTLTACGITGITIGAATSTYLALWEGMDLNASLTFGVQAGLLVKQGCNTVQDIIKSY